MLVSQPANGYTLLVSACSQVDTFLFGGIMKKLVKILGLLLVLTIAVTCIVACGDESKTVIDGLVLELINDNTEYSVVDYRGNRAEVIIPKEHNGTQITSIGDYAFYNCASLTSIIIPDSVTSIGDCAFSTCDSLTIYCEAESQPSGWDIDWNNSSCPVIWDCNNNDVTEDGYIYAIINGVRYSLKDGVATVVIQSSNITTANIPSSVTCKDDIYIVTSIGNAAFKNCTRLTSINIPDSVTSIGYSPFEYCTSLTNIVVDENNTTYMSINGNLYSKDGKELIQYAIGKTETTFIIPDSVISIGERAFSGCSIKSITIPDSVTSIGNAAFTDCTSLNKVNYLGTIDQWAEIYFEVASNTSNPLCWGNNLYINDVLVEEVVLNSTKISGIAFSGCTSIKSITILDSVTSIGQEAFRGCTSLTSITIPDSVNRIGLWVFDGCPIEKATIPAVIQSISNSNLKEVIITSGERIGERAFSGCKSLTSITISSSVTSIEEWAFDNCTSLESVTFGANSKLEAIGEYAFSYCDSLTSITIPDSATSIGNNAFYNTAYYNDESNWEDGALYIGNHLIEAQNTISGAYTVKEGTKSIADSAFEHCNFSSIRIPDSVTSIGSSAFSYCYSLNSIDVEDGNANYKSIDGNLYSKDGKELIQYAIDKTADTFTIPDGVTSIGSYAFSGCTSLASITIPNSVTSIGQAFRDCGSLTSITISDSVTSIGSYTFWYCDSLTSITIPDSVTSIGKNAFYKCVSLTSIIIPDSVMSIDYDVFEGCTSLTIYCEAESKPRNWNSNWNSSNRPVCWYSETEPTMEGNYWRYVEGVPTAW